MKTVEVWPDTTKHVHYVMQLMDLIAFHLSALFIAVYLTLVEFKDNTNTGEPNVRHSCDKVESFKYTAN